MLNPSTFFYNNHSSDTIFANCLINFCSGPRTTDFPPYLDWPVPGTCSRLLRGRLSKWVNAPSATCDATWADESRERPGDTCLTFPAIFEKSQCDATIPGVPYPSPLSSIARFHHHLSSFLFCHSLPFYFNLSSPHFHCFQSKAILVSIVSVRS